MMKGIPFKWKEGLLLAIPLFLFLAVFSKDSWMDFIRGSIPHDKGASGSCQSALRSIEEATRLYMSDNDESFFILESASSSGHTPIWSVTVQDYLKCSTCVICYGANRSNSLANSSHTDYWMNAKLSHQKSKTVLFPTSTFLAGDGNDETGSTYILSSIPPDWLTDRGKPTFRHFGGANYAFVDGHVKWLRPDEAAHFGGRSDPFALK